MIGAVISHERYTLSKSVFHILKIKTLSSVLKMYCCVMLKSFWVQAKL